MPCTFCTSKEIREREIIRSEHAYAFPGNMPIVPGHTLVCPSRCVARLEELEASELLDLWHMVCRIKKGLRQVFDAEGFNVALNEGSMAGQSVPHVHIHVVPRSAGDQGILEYEPRKFLYRPGERPVSPEQELKSVAAVLQAACA